MVETLNKSLVVPDAAFINGVWVSETSFFEVLGESYSYVGKPVIFSHSTREYLRPCNFAANRPCA